MELKDIKNPLFIKELDDEELLDLSSSIRDSLISIVSNNGGHLSSNLGVVELTIALHKTFDFSTDKLIFDIGHQTYTHKILTGRYNELVNSLRHFNGISGFAKFAESSYDHFEAGHAATALAAASGILKANELNKVKSNVVAVVGDGGLASGLSFEALNNLSLLNDKLIIILNDNDMSISKPIGNLSKNLNKIRNSNVYLNSKISISKLLKSNKVTYPIYTLISNFKKYLKRILIGKNIFENFNLKYLGPIDGHDLKALTRALNYAKNYDKSILIHVQTAKGKGFEHAEKDVKGKWHGVDRFNVEAVEEVKDTNLTWSSAISEIIKNRMERDLKIVTITPAMIEGSKLANIFATYPDRSFDVGINEEYAFTFASGLSLTGYKPFISIYSTFLQRAYDQVLHDNARIKNNILIGVDRAGLVGQDGDTHHGIYDVAFLKSIPNTIIAMPSDLIELDNLVKHSENKGMFFIRYPRGKVETRTFNLRNTFNSGKWDYLLEDNNNSNTIIVTGPIAHDLLDRVKDLNLKINIIYARFYHPIDHEVLRKLNGNVIIYDIYSIKEGLYDSVVAFLKEVDSQTKVYDFSLPKGFYQHGKIEELLKSINLDLDSFVKSITKLL